ncbi:MAG: molybdenum cofactor guanylyltransferase [Gammaproteobacteria bacterium]|nr:molybdenum cofactor guanylyltransferase [Gammaproteobacteria bacterium]
MSIAGLVLAGGKSSRMGQDKAMLTIENETLLERNVRLLKQAGCDDVFISGNYQGRSKQLNVIDDLSANIGPVSGILSSLKHLLTTSHSQVVIVAVDMPNLTIKQLQPLMSKLDSSCNGQFYHDSLFPLVIKISDSVISTIELQLNNNDKRSKSIYRLTDNLMMIGRLATEVQQPHFINVNTPEQWQNHLAQQTLVIKPANKRDST